MTDANFHKQTLPECQTVICALFQTRIFTKSPGFFVGSAHGMIPYSSATSWKCFTNSAVDGHVLMFLGTGLSWHKWPAAANQRGLDPQLHLWKDFGGGGGSRWDCQDCQRSDLGGPPIDILFLYTALYTYMIGKANILNKEHLGEDSWFNNQDALQKTGTWKWTSSMLESKEHLSSRSSPFFDAKMIHLFVSPPSLSSSFYHLRPIWRCQIHVPSTKLEKNPRKLTR